ncbi:MAG: hypothetical protein KDJ25_06610 [Rhodoblastus sp.]|nr:hypothetical protein [Rhodoblastus sp.]
MRYAGAGLVDAQRGLQQEVDAAPAARKKGALMTNLIHSKRGRRMIAIAATIGAAAGLAMSGGSAMAGDEKTISGDAAAVGGMKIYVDPATGQVTHSPPPNQPALTLTPAEQNAFSRSSQGLLEVPSSGPAGGVKVNLQGRFQSPLIATVGPDGRARIKHAGEPAHSRDAK